MLYEEQTEAQEKQGVLDTVFLNGKLIKSHSLAEIRQRICELSFCPTENYL